MNNHLYRFIPQPAGPRDGTGPQICDNDFLLEYPMDGQGQRDKASAFVGGVFNQGPDPDERSINEDLAQPIGVVPVTFHDESCTSSVPCFQCREYREAMSRRFKSNSEA